MRYPLQIASLLLAITVLTAGCRKRRGATPVGNNAPEAAQAAASVGVNPNDLPSNQVLYEAITRFMTANNGRAAKDVNELVQKGFLKPLPSLPPGKRYELDQRAAVLTIVDN